MQRRRAAAGPQSGSKKRKGARPSATARRTRPTIVALGSSAGGLDALTRLFRVMPSDSGMAFVVVQHLDPSHESFMAELLGRHTAMPVVQVEADMPVEPDHVYCIPPGRYLGIDERTLRLVASAETGSVRMPIDFFLRALAADAQMGGIGIVLSGAGTDGTLGLQAIKAAGGLAIVQDPATAQHDGMLRSAIAKGAADHVLPLEQMPGILLEYLRLPYARGAGTTHPPAEIDRDHLDDVLSILRDRTKFDFRGYKRGTLERRVGRRMGLRHIERSADYVRLLTNEPAEAALLFDDLLISVTSFFRDPEAWQLLQEQVIRPSVERKSDDTALRVWVPGCASGEEAYSIVMLLVEALQAARKTNPLQVFASDVDPGVLDFARAGIYPANIVANVSPERLRRFFVEDDRCFRVTREIRESVVFARQNLVVDPPFSNLDLISCRNVLIYFGPEAQRKIVSLLHYALAEDGHLLLGPAETIGDQEDLFEEISKKWRVYRRSASTRHRVPLPAIPELARGRPVDSSPDRPGVGRLAMLVQRLLLERFAPACVLINRAHEIQYFAGATQDYLIQPTGVPTQNLISRARAGLRTKLRSAIRRAVDDGQRTIVNGAQVRRDDGWHRVRLTLEPLSESRETEGLLLVSFVDEPRGALPARQVAVRPSEREAPVIRQLEDELRATREDLEGTIAELEGSNQELHIANEEGMSVNEELRSTNEELETSKEELQSLNEELNTVNTQLEDKVAELERANNDLDNLLTSTNIATIFLDTTFHVRRFTPVATRLFNLIPSDVGRPIADLTQRCVDPDLLRDAEMVLARQTPVSTEVQGRDGSWYIRQVLPYRTRDGRIEGVVITFSDVAAEALREARLYAEAIVDTVREPLLVLDSNLRVQSANRSFYESFQLSPAATLDRPVHELGDHQLDVPRLRTLLGELLPDQGILTDFEVEHEFAKIGRRTMLLNARTLTRGGGRPDLILLAIEDITERKRAEQSLRESEAMTRAGVQTVADGIITIDEHGTILSFNPAAEHIFGYTPAEMLGQNVKTLMPPPYRDEHDRYLTDYLRTGEQRMIGSGREVRGRRKDGTAFPLSLHVSEFAGAGEHRFVGTIRDITDRKRTEKQLQEHQAELAHVLRVATVEHMAAGLAHEITQPLSAIANDIEACAAHVRAGEHDPAPLLELLARAATEALRAGELVHHVREFVGRGTPRLETTDLCDVIRSASRWMVRDLEDEGITLRLDLASHGLPVRIDRMQIEQVLVNLLQNALDAVREGGGERREIRVRTVQSDGRMAEVAVGDSGVGFSATATARLYEPFFTTKPQGMGMGLAISHTIVEMHHGRLSVDSGASGTGATVRLALPLDRAARAGEEPR